MAQVEYYGYNSLGAFGASSDKVSCALAQVYGSVEMLGVSGAKVWDVARAQRAAVVHASGEHLGCEGVVAGEKGVKFNLDNGAHAACDAVAFAERGKVLVNLSVLADEMLVA